MKCKVQIQHKDDLYLTDIDELELEPLKELIRQALKGELAWTTFKIDGNLTFFPKSVLVNSIITIVRVEL